jgi:hypothetical protein
MDVNFATIPQATACFEMIQANGMPVKVNPSVVGVGGHSGGGPSAAILSSRYPAQVKAYIGQHAAAIPVVNRPSDEVINGIKGEVLQLCGTIDIMPFCGCKDAENDYFNRYPSSLSRMLAKAPDGHVAGTEKASGNKAEGGLVVAFLYHALLNDSSAHSALREGLSRPGYSMVDKLVH